MGILNDCLGPSCDILLGQQEIAPTYGLADDRLVSQDQLILYQAHSADRISLSLNCSPEVGRLQLCHLRGVAFPKT